MTGKVVARQRGDRQPEAAPARSRWSSRRPRCCRRPTCCRSRSRRTPRSPRRPACATGTSICAGARWSSGSRPRARLAQLVRTHLAERGFLEVQTPILTASSPEGARDFLVPSRLYPGEFYALPQAPQQFKQLLMVGGVERYFQIAPCFRDEASRADRSPGEFYQIDLEMAFATQEDVFDEVEQLMVRIVTELSAKRAKAPFPRLTFADVDGPLRHRQARPALRPDHRRADRSSWAAPPSCRCSSRRRPTATPSGPCGRPQAAGRPRKWFDTFADAARQAGVDRQLAAARPGRRGPRARWPGSSPRTRSPSIAAAVGAEPGDAVLTAVGPPAKASAVLGEQRSALGRELGLADPDELAFCWVVDFPMYERNEETGGWDFSHNPFSMPQGGLEALADQGPGRHPRLPVRPGLQRARAVVGRGPQPPARGDGEGVRHRRVRAGADPGVVPGPVERLPLRCPAPRRHRPGLRPHPHDARGPGQPAGGHRLSPQPGGAGPAHGRAEPGRPRPSCGSWASGSSRRRAPGRRRLDGLGPGRRPGGRRRRPGLGAQAKSAAARRLALSGTRQWMGKGPPRRGCPPWRPRPAGWPARRGRGRDRRSRDRIPVAAVEAVAEARLAAVQAAAAADRDAARRPARRAVGPGPARPAAGVAAQPGVCRRGGRRRPGRGAGHGGRPHPGGGRHPGLARPGGRTAGRGPRRRPGPARRPGAAGRAGPPHPGL